MGVKSRLGLIGQGNPMDAMSEAFGHVRSAAAELLKADDPSGDSLWMGAQALDLVEMFDELDVEPAVVGAGLSAAESLVFAAGLLEQERDRVPLAIWSQLRVLLDRVS